MEARAYIFDDPNEFLRVMEILQAEYNKKYDLIQSGEQE